MKPILEFPGYFVDRFGNVFSEKTSKRRILKPGIEKRGKGYLYVNLYRGPGFKPKTKKVHRIVAEAFLGLPTEGQQVNHKNGNPKDNRVENLEWVTHQENIDHCRYVLDRIPKGETHWMSKLSKEDVLKIRELSFLGVPQKLLATRFKVSEGTISSVSTRSSWRHV